MATPERPTKFTAKGSTHWPVLAGCLALSVIVHLITATSAGAYFRAHPNRVLESNTPPRLPDFAPPPPQEDPPIKLGREESKQASITWLGVQENPVEGVAPKSSVDQAELTITNGEQTESLPQPQTQPQPEEQAQPSVPVEPMRFETPPDPLVSEQQPEPDPDQQPEAQPEAQAPPEQTTPLEPISEQPEQPQVEAIDTPKVDPQPQPEEVHTPEEQPAEQPETKPDQPEELPELVARSTKQPEQSEQPAERAPQPTTTSKQGKPGEEDDRESVASMIKRADSKKASDLNRPLSSAGLEIKPVEPRYPAAVRFTQLPRNPVVRIRFNAEGKVIFADFLRDEEKRIVYDTGSKPVDEPLISAIYKWRAEGKPLEQLDPNDPDSFIEIPMKILFRDED